MDNSRTKSRDTWARALGIIAAAVGTGLVVVAVAAVTVVIVLNQSIAVAP